MIKNFKVSINAVVNGQKSNTINATPQLIVKSTVGQFTITSPVSKALGIAAGENVMFLNNISGINELITAAPADLVEYCNEKGWDINTREGQDAFIKEQTVWYIAKGVYRYKRNGEKILATIRVTKEDKAAYIAEHGLEYIQSLDEETKATFAASKGLEGADDEVLASALEPDDMQSPTIHAASGSKTSSTSHATGVGLQLNFTDTAIWDALKSDIDKEYRSNVNRVFKVALDKAEKISYDNGKEIVDIFAYPIVFAEDKAPIVRTKKDVEA